MAELSKRKGNELDAYAKRMKLEPCPHGVRCYRKNPHHFNEFKHAHLESFLDMGDNFILPDGLPQDKSMYLEQMEMLRPFYKPKKEGTLTEELPSKAEPNVNMSQIVRGTMMEKVKAAEPYGIFYNSIPKSPETAKRNNSITFPDLLCSSLGKLKCSLQINFMIDIMWLMEQYTIKDVNKKPLTVIYGSNDFPGMKEYIDRFLPNVTQALVKMKDPFGCHHSKVGIYIYEDNSLRIVVSSANLYYEDWNHYNQGLWLSPRCVRLPDSSPNTDGGSPTGFKIQLLNYLQSYKISCLDEFVGYVERADFSAVNVFLVTSIPGKHFVRESDGCHLHRVGDLLSRHCQLPVKTTPTSEGPLAWGVMAQASTIGSLGITPVQWLRSTLLRSLSVHKNTQLVSNSSATLNVIFPTVENVMTGLFGAESGGCLPYSKKINEKQRWLQDYLHKWKADGLKRSGAMPHIKTYCRVSPCMTKLAWFLLTSANISKAAWGGNIQKDGSIYVRSYEVGVMFLPKFFNQEYLEIANTLKTNNAALFPFMYDLPLTPYETNDFPYCT